MPATHYIPPRRLRRIGVLAADVERFHNALANLTADPDHLDATLKRLTQDRRRGMTRGALDILQRTSTSVPKC